MFRQNRSFTVEIKGRRKSGAFDWKSAFAAAEHLPVLPEVRMSPAKDGILSNEPTPQRILPALPKDDAVHGLTLAATRPALPQDENPVPAVPLIPASPPIEEDVTARQPAIDRPTDKATGELGCADPSMAPLQIPQMYRTRRIAAALSRGEKWKRRLPAILL